MQFYKIKRLIKIFGFLYNRHTPSSKPNVLIFSIPRSGSTWLMELVWSQPGFKPVNEPLNLKGKNTLEQWKSGILGFKQLYSNEAKTKLLDYFKGFVNGKHHHRNPSPFHKYGRFFTSRIVFKVIHGGELYINEISKETNSRIVYLIRNPIAVSLSRKQIPRIKELTSEYVMSNFSAEQQEFIVHIFSKGTEMEKKIMLWCIQNKLALSQKNPEWLVVSYEDITCNPQKVITDIARHCELPDIELMIKNVNIPSAVTTQSDDDSVSLMSQNSETRRNLISRWRDSVDSNQIEKYYQICKKMNFSIYKESIEIPDLSNL